MGRVVRLDTMRLDPTFPTRASRLRALRAYQVSVPAVGLSASESARIDAERADWMGRRVIVTHCGVVEVGTIRS